MALTNPTVVGTVATGLATHASDTITTSADIPAGAIVILAWGANASRTPSSFTGTSGLTFQQDAGQQLAAGSGGSGWLYSAKATSLISAGATVIVNFTSGNIATAGTLMYIEGADQTTWKDVSTQNSNAGSAAWDTGTTGTRTTANQVSIALAFETGSGATTNTVDSPATELNEISSSGRALVTAYEQHTSTGTSNIAGDWDLSSAWNAAIATYKEAAGGSVDLTASTGTSTAAGSATALTVSVPAATGTAAGAGGTTALTVVLTASAGSATAGGGSVSLGGTVNLTATNGTATATGGTASFAGTYVATAGVSTATGGSATIRFVYTAAAGTAAASGGDVSRLDVVADPYPLTLRFSETAGTLTVREGGVLSFTETD